MKDIMIVVVQPSKLSGTIDAPASKSSMQRACAAALITLKGQTIIRNPGSSNDDKAALDIARRLGAVFTAGKDELSVTSEGVKPINDEINCDESGLSIRMFTPLAALCDKQITIIGSGSLASRPMDFFDEVLPQLDVKVQSNDGKLPIVIQGPLIPKNITIDGSLSSQFLTGLLLAYAAVDAKQVSITVKNLVSRPYIDLTLDVMRKFRLKIPEIQEFKRGPRKDIKIFKFSRNYHYQFGHNNNSNITYLVEGDWSGAAFMVVAGAIAGNVTVKGLNNLTTQGDRRICEALQQAGAGMVFNTEANQIEMSPKPSLKPFNISVGDSPDLFPPLVALAAYCNGTSIIWGVDRLEHKESNRGLTLQEEFGKMGVEIKIEDNRMLVTGGKAVKGTTVRSHHDHRIAMACAVAALRADGEMVIEDAEAINKSYPDFYAHLKKLGAAITAKRVIS